MEEILQHSKLWLMSKDCYTEEDKSNFCDNMLKRFGLSIDELTDFIVYWNTKYILIDDETKCIKILESLVYYQMLILDFPIILENLMTWSVKNGKQQITTFIDNIFTEKNRALFTFVRNCRPKENTKWRINNLKLPNEKKVNLYLYHNYYFDFEVVKMSDPDLAEIFEISKI